MTRKLLFAFFAAQVLYLQLHFTSGKLLMTIDYCAELNYEFLVIFIKQDGFLAKFVKRVSKQITVKIDCNLNKFGHVSSFSLFSIANV